MTKLTRLTFFASLAVAWLQTHAQSDPSSYCGPGTLGAIQFSNVCQICPSNRLPKTVMVRNLVAIAAATASDGDGSRDFCSCATDDVSALGSTMTVEVHTIGLSRNGFGL